MLSLIDNTSYLFIDIITRAQTVKYRKDSGTGITGNLDFEKDPHHLNLAEIVM